MICQYITTGSLDRCLEGREVGTKASIDLSIEPVRENYCLIALFTFNDFSIKKYYAFVKRIVRHTQLQDYAKANFALEADLDYLAENHPDLQVEGKDQRFGHTPVHA